jgi:CRP/FNR family transcriptional regulator, cyclic AMP receptor protein
MTPDSNTLAGLPLFSALTEDQLATVAGWSELRTLSPGDRAVGEGASGYCFFVVRDGAAAVTQDGQELGRLGRGDFFGELAILGDGRRTATVTAVEPTTVLVFFGTEFRRLEAELPDVAAQIKQTMARRLEAKRGAQPA